MKRIPAWVTVLFGWVFAVACARMARADEVPTRVWDTRFLQDASAWPHREADARIDASSGGLRVEVSEGRTFVIAAASGLKLPVDMGKIRVRVSDTGGGAKWFVRLYGELRDLGKPLTVSVAQDETAAGERVLGVDPRLCSRKDASVQLQLGVEGPPGAFAVFQDVEFPPASKASNRTPRSTRQPGQRDIAAVELMPNLPEPFEMLDWRGKARAYDRFVFDFHARGEFLPLVWLDDSHINIDRPAFGLPSYVGAPDQGAGKRNSQEGISCMGAVLGATLAGIDKSRQEHDFVAMCEAWFNTKNGRNLVLNRQDDGTGGSFWYELFPHILFYGLADRYPDKPRPGEIMKLTAERWRQACLDLTDAGGTPDFNHTSFNFQTRKAGDNGRWREPDAAAAVAWLEYAAWMKFHDERHLAAAESCVKFLQGEMANPYYEILLPFGALTAARMNAELGREYDADRLLDWCFGISDTRGGWGVTTGNWGGYDCAGLSGSIDNRGGYAFAMNTFVQAGALVPVARYDPRHARAIGKWMLNLANSARLFYPGALPNGHETSAFWHGDPQHVIAYEGLRQDWQGKSPYATGDPVAMNWGPKTDLGLYGSSFVGFLGAIIRPTNDPRILQLDCLATDFFHDKAFPTFLYYNPYPQERRVAIDVGETPVRLYDAVSKKFLGGELRGETNVTLPADGAALIVLTPANGSVRREGRRLWANDIVVDYAATAGSSSEETGHEH